MAELELQRAERYVGASIIAIVLGALGSLDEAFEELERAYAERDLDLVHAEHSALFDSLRTDPRFRELRARAFLTEFQAILLDRPIGPDARFFPGRSTP